MAAWTIALPPKSADDFAGIENGGEVEFKVIGIVNSRNAHGSVIVDVRSVELCPVDSFKGAAKRAKVTYVRSTIEPDVG